MNISKNNLSIPEELRPIRNHLAMLGVIGIVLFVFRAVLRLKAGTIPPLSIAGHSVVSITATNSAWIILASALVWEVSAALDGARPSGNVPPQAPGFWAIVPFRLLQFLGWAGLVSAILFADPRANIEPAISLSQALFVYFLPLLFHAFLLLATGTAGVAILRLWKRNEGLLPANSRGFVRKAGFLAAFFAVFTVLSAASVARMAVEMGIALLQFAVLTYFAALCFRFRLTPEPPAETDHPQTPPRLEFAFAICGQL